MTLDLLGTPAYGEWGERAPAIDRAVEVLNGHDGNSDVGSEISASLLGSLPQEGASDCPIHEGRAYKHNAIIWGLLGPYLCLEYSDCRVQFHSLDLEGNKSSNS